MDFANTFSAAMLGVKTEDYVSTMQKLLADLGTLDQLAENMTVDSWDKYMEARRMGSLTSSAYCYAANNDMKTEAHKAIDIECAINKKAQAWVKTQLGSEIERLMIQYLLWRRHYSHDDSWRIRAFKTLLESGRLWQKNGNYYLTGIHKKLGDNSYDMNGNRCYYESSFAQAFELVEMDRKTIAEFVCDPVPELPEHFSIIWLGDGKGSARPISLSKKQKNDILNLINAS